jgi:hypothetical protein
MAAKEFNRHHQNSLGEDHEKAEYAWHDRWRYAFMRGSCVDALVTNEGGAVVS